MLISYLVVVSIPRSTRNGEYEGAEFWDSNEALIRAALLELGPLHPYVYAPQNLSQIFEPAVIAALESPTPSRRSAVVNYHILT